MQEYMILKNVIIPMILKVIFGKINTVHPFYFGAHEGFRMLNSIVKINTENHENAVETFSTGNVYGEGYTYKIAGASIEINSESEWHIAYFACNDKNSLLINR